MRRIVIEFNEQGSATLDALTTATDSNPSTVVYRALVIYALARGVADPDGTVRLVGSRMIRVEDV